MVDRLTPAQRKRCMRANRSQGTQPERLVMRALTSAGYSYSRYVPHLRGKPDIVFLKQRVAIFVDGDFWHGFRYPAWKRTLPDYWRAKIERNRLRDQQNIRALRRSGWRVIRVWEHQIYDDISAVVRRIATSIRRQSSS